MSARRAKQDFKAGVQQLENMWDSLAEKHLSECILLHICVQEDQHSLNIPFSSPYGWFFSVCPQGSLVPSPCTPLGEKQSGDRS